VRHGEAVVTNAIGESMTGVPATTDMHFRNGAVAIGYLSTLVLVLVDDGVVGIDDTIDAWLPDLPDAEQVTLRMLLDMSAGYPDYVPDPAFARDYYADPFHNWTPEEKIELGLNSMPRTFAPGTNWDYSHTNVVILGRALEIATGRPLAELLREKVFAPLGLTQTYAELTPSIPEPALHAFSSERKSTLGVAEDVRFYEESTYWNPSWTIADGAVTVSTIEDMTAVAIDWGNGSLLTPESHAVQITPFPVGFGELVEGCRNCHPLDDRYNYALGLVISDGWILQNPYFSGYSAVTGYLPAEDLAIAVAVTYSEDGFTADGEYRTDNKATAVMHALATLFTPNPPALN
jgi:CubicO group peptidase (beta-lactamase class C family)